MLNLYPQQHVIRDGRVLVSGPDRDDVGIFNPSNWAFTPIAPKPCGNHYQGLGGAAAGRAGRLEQGDGDRGRAQTDTAR